MNSKPSGKHKDQQQWLLLPQAVVVVSRGAEAWELHLRVATAEEAWVAASQQGGAWQAALLESQLEGQCARLVWAQHRQRGQDGPSQQAKSPTSMKNGEGWG